MNARGQHIDKTHLSVDQAEERGFIHRDYIAHCLRWTHVVRYLYHGQRYKKANILDIGCGRDFPLAKTMFTSRLVPETGSYLGLDYNTLVLPEMFDNTRWKPEFIGNIAFPDVKLDKKFDVIVCFEVLEHVEPLHAFKMLQGIKENLAGGGVAFISTPCYDERMGAADNHVSEIKYEVLGSLIEKVELGITKIYGTFASIRDYKGQLEKDGLTDVFEKFHGYYDSNYLATIFAPMYPWLARNCLWELTGDIVSFKFPGLDKIAAPLGSSENWGELLEYLSAGKPQ